jgi:uncharacterized protein (DUF2249 family)
MGVNNIHMADATIDLLTTALLTALRRLGECGQPVAASQLAARTYAQLRHDEPRIADRLNGVMHHLARLEAAASSAQRSSPMADDRLLDVRTEPPARRHKLIFDTFGQLSPGEAFVLVNDHDPKPLYYQLAAERPDSFTWIYVEEGPLVWRVRISRTAAATVPAGQAS